MDRSCRLYSPLLLPLLAALCACDGSALSTRPDLSVEADPRMCGAGVVAVADEGAAHMPDCQRLSYVSDPPASGSHWPWRADWGVYLDRVIPRERWVHNLEHGGIVLLFNCPGVASLPASECGGPDAGPPPIVDGGAGAPCPEITSALKQLREERPLDVFNSIRVLVTPDPQLKTKVAAVAWGWVWTGDTVDMALLRCFRDMRYDRGPEHAP